MTKRILYFSSLASIFIVWVVGQVPQPTPTTPGNTVPPPPGIPGLPGVPSRGTPTKPNSNATPEANGIINGRLPNIPAGQDNRAINAPNPNDVSTIAFEFPAMDAETLIYVYRQITGRRVVMSAEVKDLQMYFMQRGPITYGEATELLKAACLIHGFVFSPGGDGWDILTAAASTVKPPLNGNIPLINSEVSLPDDNVVVRYVMSLDHIKPDEAVRVFQTVLGGQFNSYGSIVAVPNAASLVITDNVSLIRFLIELQKKIDVPSSKVETKFIKVEYGDVEELAGTLSELFSAQANAQSTSAVQRVQQQNIVPQGIPQGGGAVVNIAGASGSSNAGEIPPVQILPDLRTNRIIVMARPVDVVFVENLIKQFDVPSDTRNFLRRKLRFLPVGDFLDVAGDALTRAFGGAAEGGASGGGGRASTATSTGRGAGSTLGGSTGGSRSSRSGFGTNQFGGGNSTGGFGGGGSSFGGNSNFGGGSSFSGGGGLSGGNNDIAPVSVLVGRTLLVADKISNSILVQGPPSGVEIINNLLDQIDVKADQVMISTVFGQLTLGNRRELGVDWLRAAERIGNGSVAIGAGNALPLPTAISNGGLGLYGTYGNNLDFYLKAIQTDSDFKVISTPSIVAANNQTGRISSGQQIAVPANSFNGGLNGGQTTNIEYRDVVLSLEVIPLVNDEHTVTLQIQLVSQGVGQNRPIGSGENAFEVPDIIQRELVTTVTVPNNQTVVLGGLITEEKSDSRKGIPVLSRIPGIGNFFSTTTEEKNRNELLIFIQPQIIRDKESEVRVNNYMNKRYDMSDDMRISTDDASLLPPPIAPVEETPSQPKAPLENSTKPALAPKSADPSNAKKARPVGVMPNRFR